MSTEPSYEAVARSLVEFGYPDVTSADVAEAVRRHDEREPITDVVHMFALSQLGIEP